MPTREELIQYCSTNFGLPQLDLMQMALAELFGDELVSFEIVKEMSQHIEEKYQALEIKAIETGFRDVLISDI